MNKKLLILSLLALPLTLFGQGRVQFANTGTTQITTNSPTGASGPTTGGNSYLFGLYIAPVGTVDPTAFTMVGTATNGTVPVNNGRFNGGNPFVIPGNNGEAIAFQIRAWTFSAGETYELATDPLAYKGVSAIGQVTPTTGTALVPALFGTGPGQIGGFSLQPIPEPSTIALGLLGLGAIALFRRRK